MNRLRRILPMALMLGVGLVIWRYGMFGLLPTDRIVVWRLPVSYGEVRKLELQVWDEQDLLKREEQLFAAGLIGEPTLAVPLSSGPHRAIANVWLRGATSAIGFQRDFNPGADETVLIEMKKQ